MKGSILISYFGSTSPSINGFGGITLAVCAAVAKGGSYWPVAGYVRNPTLSTSTVNLISAIRGNYDANCAGMQNAAAAPSSGGANVPPGAAAGGYIGNNAADFAHFDIGSQNGFGFSLGNGTGTAATVVAGAMEFIDDAGLYQTVLTGLYNRSGTASVTRYYGPWNDGGQTGESGESFVFPVAGTISKFVVCTDGTAPTNSETVTVNNNTVATALTITIAAADSGRGCYVDSTHTVTVAAGDLVDYAVVTGASTVSGFGSMYLVFTPASGTGTLIGGALTSQTATASAVYSVPGTQQIPATAAAGAIAMPIACTLSRLYISMSTSNANVPIFTAYKNGVAQALTGTAANSATSQALDLVHSVSYAQGDLLTMQIVTGGGTSGAIGGWSAICQ